MSNLYKRTFHRCFLPSFGSFGQAVSEEKIFKHQLIRKKNCLWQPCLLMNQDEMSNVYRAVPEMRASKILVTGPNGIMVAHKFCDIFL
jgi:hypothetical protein